MKNKRLLFISRIYLQFRRNKMLISQPDIVLKVHKWNGRKSPSRYECSTNMKTRAFSFIHAAKSELMTKRLQRRKIVFVSEKS